MATNSNEPISKAFKRKSWNEQRTNDSWAIFKIMSEFVEGYERLSRIGPCVSIFGSARLKEDDAWYQDAQRIAEGLGKKGYGIISGGGPGIMEAANRGAMVSLLELVATTHIVFGTDFPPGDSSADVARMLDETGLFNEADLRAINRENVVRLLPRFA